MRDGKERGSHHEEEKKEGREYREPRLGGGEEVMPQKGEASSSSNPSTKLNNGESGDHHTYPKYKYPC